MKNNKQKGKKTSFYGKQFIGFAVRVYLALPQVYA